MRKRLTVTLVVLLLITGAIILFSTSSPVQYTESFFQSVFESPKAFLYNAKISLFHSKMDVVSQLKSENKALSEKMADYEQMKRDNAALRDQFAQTNLQASDVLPARIVGFQGDASHPTEFVINRGSNDGVRSNMTVVEGKQLIGQIGMVSQTYSVVYLPVSSRFSTVGQTSTTNTDGVVKGEGDFILFDNVLTTDKLQKNDIVVTKGDVQMSGVGIQPGFIIGKIVSVSNVPSRPFQNAEVQSFLDYSKLSLVFVILH